MEGTSPSNSLVTRNHARRCRALPVSGPDCILLCESIWRLYVVFAIRTDVYVYNLIKEIILKKV